MIAHGTRIEGSPRGIPHTALHHTQGRPVSVREKSGPEEANVPCGNWRLSQTLCTNMWRKICRA